MSEKESTKLDILNVIFMIDTSGSMQGAKINSVNSVMEPIRDELMQFERTNNRNAEIRFSAIKFDSTVEWIVAPPKPLEDFRWNKIDASGQTFFGQACREVEKKIHSGSDFFPDDGRVYANPLLILLSDGEPYGEGSKWREGFLALENNSHYNVCPRIAIGLPGINAEGRAVLEKFASEDGYIEVTDIAKIKDAISLVTLSASKSASILGSTDVNGAKNVVSDAASAVTGMSGIKTANTLKPMKMDTI